ncbi:hypothetical protein [Sphingomonas sp. ID1715]|uniref:hypothetical protein n=1 Tax=Sphingomonas sp. ID1715 TaxID=1656898 RepID=UPI0020C221E1|nr:hypothetical protein [Sphingomonas sp. ID1715]
MLARLASAPVPAELARIDAVVLERITARPAPMFGYAALAGAAFLALLTGVAGGMWPGSPQHAPETLTPFGPSSPLAPSTLLASNQ